MKRVLFSKILLFLLMIPALVFAQGGMMQQEEGSMQGMGHGEMMHHGEMPPPITNAVCVLTPTEGNHVHGVVHFAQTEEGMKVTARVEGLTPGKHGFHIHQFGDITAANGTSAGGHFNPMGHEHGGPMKEMRHPGDLGNLEADKDGVAIYEWTDPHMMLYGPLSILGRGMVVHAGEDDLTSQPTGAAGSRVAVGVIGVAKGE